VLDSSAASRLALPETVRVALDEIATDMREGLLALAVGTGLQVMQQLMEADVTAVCGPRLKHDPARSAVRHGTEAGSVTLGGRRVPVRRPRVRTADGTGEVPVPAYELFSSTEILGRMAMAKMVAGVCTRRYPVGLEPVGERTERAATATSKSAISRRFVAATETALAELLAAPLHGLDLVALMIDRGALRRSPVRGGARDRHRRNQAPARPGRRLHGEHHRGHRSARRAAGPGPGHDPADLRRHRRRQGAPGRRGAGVRPPGDRSVPAAQAEECC
jgi:hypothetical protein